MMADWPRTMSVRPRSKFDKPFSEVKPDEIGYFSLVDNETSNGRFIFDRQQMKFFCPPENPNKVNFDLNKGFDAMIKNRGPCVVFDALLKWVQCKKPFSKQNDEREKQRYPDPNFMCKRGLLQKLLCTLYEERNGWKLFVRFFDNTYYMWEYGEDGEKTEYDENTYGGWKFEQYLTSDTESSQPNTSKPVNLKEKFYTVVYSSLNDHSLVYSAEIDAAEKDGAVERGIDDKYTYVEFKTNRQTDTNRLTDIKGFKLLKWWAQSYLVGIKKIVCGFRNVDRIVHELRTFTTQEISKRAKDLRNPWQPNVCFNFLDQFLTFLKDAIHDDRSSYYQVEWKPDDDVRILKLEGEPTYCFPPEWYTASCGTSYSK